MPSGAPPARPRLVASDLDGTLLRSDGRVSPRTGAAWSALPAHGIQTVLVTARPPRWLHDLEDLVGEHGIAVCANGAFVYDVPARTVVAAHCLSAALVEMLVRELRDGIPGIRFAAERAGGQLVEPGYPDPHPEAPPHAPVVAPVDGPGGEPIGKLLAIAPGRGTGDFIARVSDLVGDRAQVAYSGAHGLAEINAPGVTKAAGLARWAGERGIAAAEVWAFGDMPNDLPMLAWAGRGYAVANAHPDVLAAADAVCAANDDDGVARVVEGLLDTPTRSAGKVD